MRNQFFACAIEAAIQSPEKFAAVFEKKEANANVKEYEDIGLGGYGDPLIHALIKQIPDVNLPAILTILIQHKVDLSSRDHMDDTPLSIAAFYHKKATVQFLIEHKVEINDPICPALSRVFVLDKGDTNTLAIIKYLCDHRADINIQDKFTQSVLHRAAEARYLESMRYIISRGANQFLKYTYASGTESKTALGAAHGEYISSREAFNEDDPYTRKAKACFDFLMQVAADYLYRQGVSFKGDDKQLEIHLRKFIDALAGNFRNIYSDKSNSDILKKLLEENVLIPVLARVKREKEERHTFLMGSRLSASQRESKATKPPIHRFFQRIDHHPLMSKIFSYLHEVTPYTKEKKNTPI
ncbi:MAG: ankyrin repeat domain-containing protein [Gammaproteobacteria bacterium]